MLNKNVTNLTTNVLLFLFVEQQEDIPLTKVALTKSERKVKQVPIRYLKALVKANKVLFYVICRKCWSILNTC